MRNFMAFILNKYSENHGFFLSKILIIVAICNLFFCFKM